MASFLPLPSQAQNFGDQCLCIFISFTLFPSFNPSCTYHCLIQLNWGGVGWGWSLPHCSYKNRQCGIVVINPSCQLWLLIYFSVFQFPEKYTAGCWWEWSITHESNSEPDKGLYFTNTPILNSTEQNQGPSWLPAFSKIWPWINTSWQQF